MPRTALTSQRPRVQIQKLHDVVAVACRASAERRDHRTHVARPMTIKAPPKTWAASARRRLPATHQDPDRHRRARAGGSRRAPDFVDRGERAATGVRERCRFFTNMALLTSFAPCAKEAVQAVMTWNVRSGGEVTADLEEAEDRLRLIAGYVSTTQSSDTHPCWTARL